MSRILQFPLVPLCTAPDTRITNQIQRIVPNRCGKAIRRDSYPARQGFKRSECQWQVRIVFCLEPPRMTDSEEKCKIVRMHVYGSGIFFHSDRAHHV